MNKVKTTNYIIAIIIFIDFLFSMFKIYTRSNLVEMMHAILNSVFNFLPLIIILPHHLKTFKIFYCVLFYLCICICLCK